MYDIFLSYSTQDRERLRLLFTALSRQGWSVFWDHQAIHTGENWHLKIDEAINNSRCVVVVWSTHSVKSEWVLEEAHKGKNRGVLLPIRIDAVEPPFGFSLRQAGNFIHWNGKRDHPVFIELVAQIYGLLGKPSESPPTPPTPQPQSRSGLIFAGLAVVAMAGSGVWYMQSQITESDKQEVKTESAAVVAPVAQPLPVPPAAEKTKGYRLIVSVTPANAAVTVDGNAFDPDKELAPGRYTVKATADGYRPMETTITIQNQDEKLSLELGKLEPERLPFEPEMVDIPAGSFTMGCKEGRDDVAGGCSESEKPAHEVSISAFQIGKYEVTFDEWDACEKVKVCPHADDVGWGRGSRPVINVNWSDITQQYIPWLNQQTGRNYRLPTEAEWEYAARGGKDTAYPWGDKISCGDANYGYLSQECSTVWTMPVGSYAANNYGLHDMSGNVWEWVADCYQENYQEAGADGTVREGCGTNAKRSARGGSWFLNSKNSRTAFRLGPEPSMRDIGLGFRLALGY